MKKFLVLFLVLFLLTSCFSSKSPSNEDINVGTENVNNNTGVVENDLDIEDDTKINEKVDTIDINKNLESYGVSLNNCDELNSDAKQDCVNGIYSSTAVGFLDLELCSAIESNNDLRIMCNLETIKSIAVSKKDKSICDDIKSIDYTSETTDFTNRIDIFVKECLAKF